MENKKGAEWISTVLYTLIAFALIGLLLAFVRPKIAEMKDSFIIEQTISSLNDFDKIIADIRQATNNKRSYELHLTRGEFIIDTKQDKITFHIPDSNYMFSELGVPYQTGTINAMTTKSGSLYDVILEIDYRPLNLTVSGNEELKTLQAAKTPYTLWMENKGAPFISATEPRGPQQIDITL